MYWLFVIALLMLGYSIFASQGAICIVISIVLCISMLMLSATTSVAQEEGFYEIAIASRILSLVSGSLMIASIFTHDLLFVTIGFIVFLISIIALRISIKNKEMQ